MIEQVHRCARFNTSKEGQLQKIYTHERRKKLELKLPREVWENNNSKWRKTDLEALHCSQTCGQNVQKRPKTAFRQILPHTNKHTKLRRPVTADIGTISRSPDMYGHNRRIQYPLKECFINFKESCLSNAIPMGSKVHDHVYRGKISNQCRKFESSEFYGTYIRLLK